MGNILTEDFYEEPTKEDFIEASKQFDRKFNKNVIKIKRKFLNRVLENIKSGSNIGYYYVGEDEPRLTKALCSEVCKRITEYGIFKCKATEPDPYDSDDCEWSIYWSYDPKNITYKTENINK